MRYYINYFNKGGSNTDNFEVLVEKEKSESYDFKEEYKKNNVVPNEEGEVGIVLNEKFGGFGLSNYALKKLGIEDEGRINVDRFNPALVKLVEDENQDGKINGDYARLDVEYIPFEYYEPAKFGRGYSWDAEYFKIQEYEGSEAIELNFDKMNIINLLKKMRDVVNSEVSSKKKIQIFENILNIPGDEFTISKIVENSNYVPDFGEEYFKSKSNFDKNNI